MRNLGAAMFLAVGLLSALAHPTQAQALCPQGQYWGAVPCSEPQAGGIPVPWAPGPATVPASAPPLVLPSWGPQWVVYFPTDPMSSSSWPSYRVITVPGANGYPTPALCLPVAQYGNLVQSVCSAQGVPQSP